MFGCCFRLILAVDFGGGFERSILVERGIPGGLAVLQPPEP